MKKTISLFFMLVFITESFSQKNDSLPPPIIPYWAFGHWIWEDEKNTREAVEMLVNGYVKRNIPVSAIIIDSPWMNNYNDFEWDTIRYPGFPDLIDSLHNKGIRVLAFYTGCINSMTFNSQVGKCKTFDFVVNNNYAINHNKESVGFKGSGLHYDPTNPFAKAWWHTQVNKLNSMKLDGAKIDFGFAWFGDTIQTSVGAMPRRDFAYQYYSDNFDYNSSENDEFVVMTYAWSGLGLMGFPSKSHVNWVGDFRGDWKGIKAQIKNIYLSANYGFSGVGCEIGGYWKAASNKEQFIRYAQLGSLCPVMINGGALGAFAHHLPWSYDDETVSIYTKFVELHYNLSSYLFSAAVDAHLNRSTILKNCSLEQESHFLGDQIFVKVKSDSLLKTVIKLPATGKWIDFWSDDSAYNSNTTIEKTYTLNQYPIFIKSGAILPWKIVDNISQKGEISNDKNITFLMYPDSISYFEFHKPLGNGVRYSNILVSMDKIKGKIRIDSELEYEFIFNVKWAYLPKKVKNADKWAYDSQKKVIRIEKTGKNFEINLY